MTSRAWSRCHGKSNQTSVGGGNAKFVTSNNPPLQNGASHQSDGHYLIRKAVEVWEEREAIGCWDILVVNIQCNKAPNFLLKWDLLSIGRTRGFLAFQFSLPFSLCCHSFNIYQCGIICSIVSLGERRPGFRFQFQAVHEPSVPLWASLFPLKIKHSLLEQ